MLLVEITINAVVNRVSVEGHALTYNWKPQIIGFDAPTLCIPTDHGGYAKMQFGSITFNPYLFEDDWPPPASCPIAIYYTDTTEAARELIFSGTAHLASFNRAAISYNLYGPSYDETWAPKGVGPLVVNQIYEITDYVSDDNFTNVGASSNATGVIFTATGTTPTHWAHFSTLAPRWNGTLNAVVTAIIGAIPEITTVDTTYARVSSPNVLYTLTSERLAINVASDIAAFYSHLIYVVGSTAYLVDMKLDNGTRTLTEYEYFAEPEYRYKTPYAMITCSSGGVVYNAKSSYAYGPSTDVEPFHETQANIEAALADIIALENAPRISLDVPMVAGNFPSLGEKITIPDTAHVADLSSYIRVRKLQYNFFDMIINIEGEGAIAAA